LLNNKTYNIKNYDTIIKPEVEKLIPEKGIIRNGAVGNLYIKFHINFPNHLNKEVIEFLKQHL
jgi:DnaJ-class molecular chaperone with C-terminal Zn finger domain